MTVGSREFAISPSIFISYRRGDSAGSAGRLYDNLARALPAQGFSYDLKVPLPRTLSAIGTKHKTILKYGLRI
jgi:hypothetical protein